MLTLWGRATSSNVMKVIWLLEEMGHPYERIDAGLSFGRTATPEYRAMNPLGVVPSIVDGDLTMFESNAILRYLCTAYGQNSPLFPDDARARGRIDQWMDFQQTALSRTQSTVFQGLIRIAPEKRDWTAIHAAIADGNKIWGIINDRLGRQDYVATGDFTIADITFGVHVHRWLNLDIPGKIEQPNLSRWYDRLLTRPAYKAHVAGPIT